MSKIIALAVYLDEDGYGPYCHNIFSETELTAVQNNTHPLTRDCKTIIVYPDLKTEDHT